MGRTSAVIPFSLMLLLTFAGAAHSGALSAAPARAPGAQRQSPQTQGQNEADEAYQVLAGLCERKLWDLAAREGRTFLERWPRHARAELARYRLASALWELGKKDEAAREYAALERARNFEFAPEVAFRLGQIALEAGDAAKAADAFERALAGNRDYLVRPATFLLGEALFRAERFADAEQRYTALVAQDPKAEHSRAAECALVWCAFRQGHHEQAVERALAFERSRQREEGAGELISEVAFLRGESLLALGRADEAAEAYRAAISGPQADSAQRGLGFALSAAGDHAGAARAFRELCERFPESRHAQEGALHAGIELLRSGDAERARAALEDPRIEATPEALYWLAQAQRQSGEAQASIATLDRALRGKPERELAGRLQAARGDALSDLGRSDEALESYRASGGDYGLYAAAVAALNSGRSEEAVQLAKQILSTRQDSAYRTDAMLVAGEGLLALGRHAEAERAFQQIVAVDPQSEQASRAALRAAWCRYLAGDFGPAAEAFEAVLQRYADRPQAEEALYMAGLAREAAGEAPAAVQHWSRWIDRYPNGEKRAEVLLGLARLEPGEQGAQRLSQALAASPEGAAAEEALFRLGDALAAKGDSKGAAQAYERLLTQNPESTYAPGASYALAWLRYEAGDVPGAESALRPVLANAQAPEDLRLAARELAVWCKSKQSDAPGAAQAWQELARECRDDQRVLAALKGALGACRASKDGATGGTILQIYLDRVRDGGLAAEALVEGAWLALDTGEKDIAESAVRTAARIAPKEALAGPCGAALAEAAFFVGEARFADGGVDKASELYALAAPHAQGELAARVAYKQGFVALQRGDLEQAEQAFGRLIAEHADSELYGESLYLLGEARYRRGDWRGTLEPLAKLAESLPRHQCMSKALLRLGLAQGQLGAWRECEAALSELLSRERDFPQAPEAQLWRGRALAARGDARGARGAFEATVAADRGELGAQARLEIGNLARAAGDLDAALSEYLKVAVLYAHEPTVAEALCLAGDCLAEQGQRDAAVARYREVLASHPDQPAAARAKERLRELQGGA
jgi:TolA-binding protein